jgi:hypothetical protein
MLSLLPTIVLGCLVFADWTQTRHWNDGTDGLPDQLGAAIEYGDHLHFVGHLVLGRLFDWVPWAQDIAADQYDRAGAHARTARQQALVTSERPQNTGEAVSDLGGIALSGLRWAYRGTTWLLMRSLLG